jgi:hypothetical protein
MRMRIVLLEDGDRLGSVMGMGPAAIWESVAGTLDTMLASFRLTAPRGAKAPLAPGDAASASEGS